MADLLLEFFSEEIPARMQTGAAEGLKARLVTALTEAGLAPTQVTAWVTPRRVALHVTGLPLTQPDRREERKGPRLDAPDSAIEGFLKSTGFTRAELETRMTDKGAILFAVTKVKGRAARDILPELVCGVIQGFTWPKSMRWGDVRLAWVRPLRSILAIFDGQRLAGGLHLGRAAEGGEASGYRAAGASCDPNYLPFTAQTRGHCFLAPAVLDVTDAADYQTKLQAAYVQLDPAERRRVILAESEKLAESVGCRLKPDPALLEEVVGLVEWPVPLLGRIDAAFMELPAEVLTTSMRAHQKYFALMPKGAGRDDSQIAPYFITVANMVTRDGGRAILAGNQRVLRARLSDARFFWDQDRKLRLEAWGEKLDARIFHARLGSVAERIERLAALAGGLAKRMGEDEARAERAARLAKADLATGMVGEFPELQGVIGGYYARHQKEEAAVAQAIAEHYAPLGPSDRVPSARLSAIVALADKLDLLAGFFAIDEKPTGSKDPFALRRAALGVLRILTENDLRLPLTPILDAAVSLYAARLPKLDVSGTVSEILAFLAERLRVSLREQGQRHDLIEAVFALGGEDDVVRLLARVGALGDFITTPVGMGVLAAYRRAANILKIEEKKNGYPARAAITGALLIEAEEKTLAEALLAALPGVEAAVARERFVEAMTRLGTLRDPVDSFFSKVTVNVDDKALRANRLALLARVRTICLRVADFDFIEG